MRTLNRNKQKFTYCLSEGEGLELVDENDNRTGEKAVGYLSGVEMYANISPATGIAKTEIFGDLTDYDKVIVTDDVNCPINEETVLFIDKEPEYITRDVRYVVGFSLGGVYREMYITVQLSLPIYDYIVKRVAKSLNSVSIAVSKVRVG